MIFFIQVTIIENLVMGYSQTLESHSKFNQSGNQQVFICSCSTFFLVTASDSINSTYVSNSFIFIIHLDEESQDPTVLLWTNFYLAQHFDYFQKIKEALMYIDKVLEHTPTLIEGYAVKAKIFKVKSLLQLSY